LREWGSIRTLPQGSALISNSSSLSSAASISRGILRLKKTSSTWLWWLQHPVSSIHTGYGSFSRPCSSLRPTPHGRLSNKNQDSYSSASKMRASRQRKDCTSQIPKISFTWSKNSIWWRGTPTLKTFFPRHQALWSQVKAVILSRPGLLKARNRGPSLMRRILERRECARSSTITLTTIRCQFSRLTHRPEANKSRLMRAAAFRGSRERTRSFILMVRKTLW
jgi:hypothetical protein